MEGLIMVNKVFIIFSILICMVLLYGCDSETDYLEGEKISFSIDASESKIEYIVVSMPGSSLIKLIQNQDEIEEVLLQLNNIDVVKQDEDILDDEKVRNRFVYALGITVAFSNEGKTTRSEEHTSELQSRPHLVCRLLLEKKKKKKNNKH